MTTSCCDVKRLEVPAGGRLSCTAKSEGPSIRLPECRFQSDPASVSSSAQHENYQYKGFWEIKGRGTWHRCSALENCTILSTSPFLRLIVPQPLPWSLESQGSLQGLPVTSPSHCKPAHALPEARLPSTFTHYHNYSPALLSRHSTCLVLLTPLARSDGAGGSPQLWRGESRRRKSALVMLTLVTQLGFA